MRPFNGVIGILGASLLAAAGPAVKAAEMKVYSDPEHADADFNFQGEYADAGAELGAQVRALGHGAFRTMFFAGGLPGDGWDGKTIIQKAPSTDNTTPADARLEGDKVVIDQVYHAVCDGQAITGQTDTGRRFELKRVHRRSPTLGALPPAGAIVLFDGSNTDEWEPGAHMTHQKWITSDGGATTRRKFQDFTLHVEFMISYMPETRTIWQRPNSGVYLQQRYEIQILDSFGVVEGQHDCGVLYAQVTPDINMCYPPLTWQTYDIDFRAARYDAAGRKTKLGHCTVKFNGVTVLDDVEIKGPTPGGIAESPDPAGIYLQAHGHPIFFKNIWILEKNQKTYQPAPLPRFAGIRGWLPSPIFEERPEWVSMYWKSWELAFKNFHEPAPGSGYVSPFIDAAFNENIFVKATAFI